MRQLILAAILFSCASAGAQTVSMTGRLGDKALLMIDGRPRTVAVGSTEQGVKLVSLTSDSAVLEIGGQRNTVRMGESQVRFSRDSFGPSRVVMTGSHGGHFMSGGLINGREVKFMVDTGATFLSMSQAEADRLGINYRAGRPGRSSTANGVVEIHLVKLDKVVIGDVEVHDIEASVSPSNMPFILLGNSVLNRFQMKREDNLMVLEKRP